MFYLLCILFLQVPGYNQTLNQVRIGDQLFTKCAVRCALKLSYADYGHLIGGELFAREKEL